MKLIETENYYWNIHFFDTLYSNRLYQNFNSIKELCDHFDCKRKDFEIYKTYKY